MDKFVKRGRKKAGGGGGDEEEQQQGRETKAKTASGASQ
jgi:hypothetical protein